MPTWLFRTSDFPARWHCGNWTSLHGWTHIFSDAVIFLSYMAIPLALGFLFQRRKVDLPYPKLLGLFAAFIFFCGCTHLLEVIIFWHPVYRFSALIKMATAIVSVATVWTLLPSLPGILALRSPIELERIVQKRTAELQRVNEELAIQHDTQQLLVHQLSYNNKKLNNFAYVASHDLKAPVRSLLKLCDFLYNGESLSKEQFERYLSLIKNQARSVESMLQGLFEYSRMEDIDRELEQVDLNVLLQDLLRVLETPPHKHIEIGEMPTFETLRTPLKQVLQNLISNAIQHGGPHITVSCAPNTWKHQSVYTIQVHDDGEGILAVFHERIFELFRTLKTREEGAGTGVGLAIVKRIAEEVGGDVEIQSEEGAGTTFLVHWPQRISPFPATHHSSSSLDSSKLSPTE